MVILLSTSLIFHNGFLMLAYRYTDVAEERNASVIEKFIPVANLFSEIKQTERLKCWKSDQHDEPVANVFHRYHERVKADEIRFRNTAM